MNTGTPQRAETSVPRDRRGGLRPLGKYGRRRSCAWRDYAFTGHADAEALRAAQALRRRRAGRSGAGSIPDRLDGDWLA